MDPSVSHRARPGLAKRIGLFLGPAIAIAVQLIGVPEGTTREAWIVLSLMAVMAVWWVSEAIPIPVTALLPMIVLPLGGVMEIDTVTKEYMHKVVVLLMGGFIIAKAVERWHLHERIALNIVARAGSRPSLLVAGFMAAAALLSMWISNTATAIMMMPIALSVAASILGDDNDDPRLVFALLLGVAYACSIGGLGTLVGTPTNLIVQGYLNENAGFSINFLQWMMLGLPTVFILVPLAWLVLTRWVYPIDHIENASGAGAIRARLDALGAMTKPEARTLMVFAVVAFLWIFGSELKSIEIAGVQPLAGLSDHVTAIIGVVLCFLVPSGARDGGAVLDWKTAESIPWGVLLLFGGGMALAAGIRSSGLGDWIAGEFSGLTELPVWLMMAIIAGLVIFITEVTSNVATASALMPVITALALGGDVDPALLAVPLGLAASCAFMLPMATGPNAVVYSTGRVDISTMSRAGFRLNLLAIPAITAIAYLLVPMVFR